MIKKMRDIYLWMKKFFIRLIASYRKIKSKTSSWFVKNYPSKSSLDLNRTLGGLAAGFLVLAIVSSLMFSPEDDTSSYRSTYSLGAEEDIEVSGGDVPKEIHIRGVAKGKKLSGSDPGSTSRASRRPIKFRAKQVLVRSDLSGDQGLPVGTHFIGRLLSNVDSRHSDKFVRVLLPFGGKFKGRIGLPESTILLGTASYPGNGKRLFISFHTGVLPSGREIKISASALDAKDFSPGLIAEYHSAFGQRAGATLGFAFLSGASEVLQDKEALGDSSTITKKSTLKNAILNGVSEFSKTEGAFQLEGVRGQRAYVTLNQGKELIVSLKATLIQREQQ